MVELAKDIQPPWLVVITDLVKVDDRLPELVRLAMEVSHANLSEVTWMVLVHVRAMMMLTTGHTATTWMLSVLAYGLKH